MKSNKKKDKKKARENAAAAAAASSIAQNRYKLHSSSVRRLQESYNDLTKGEALLAIFPETTSFYPATVHKTPKPVNGIMPIEVQVKFDDDEDDTGKTPARKVKMKHILRPNALATTKKTSAKKSKSSNNGALSNLNNSDNGINSNNVNDAIYADMIADALSKLVNNTGNLKQILDYIQA